MSLYKFKLRKKSINGFNIKFNLNHKNLKTRFMFEKDETAKNIILKQQ